MRQNFYGRPLASSPFRVVGPRLESVSRLLGASSTLVEFVSTSVRASGHTAFCFDRRVWKVCRANSSSLRDVSPNAEPSFERRRNFASVQIKLSEHCPNIAHRAELYAYRRKRPCKRAACLRGSLKNLRRRAHPDR